FVVNKSDRPGAESLVNELKQSIKMDEKDTPVFTTVATDKKGVQELSDHFFSTMNTGDFRARRYSAEKVKAEALALLRYKNEQKILKATRDIRTFKDLLKLLIKK